MNAHALLHQMQLSLQCPVVAVTGNVDCTELWAQQNVPHWTTLALGGRTFVVLQNGFKEGSQSSSTRSCRGQLSDAVSKVAVEPPKGTQMTSVTTSDHISIFLQHYPPDSKEFDAMRPHVPVHRPCIFIYGHSHKPSVHYKSGVLYLNPGSAGMQIPETVWVGAEVEWPSCMRIGEEAMQCRCITRAVILSAVTISRRRLAVKHRRLGVDRWRLRVISSTDVGMASLYGAVLWDSRTRRTAVSIPIALSVTATLCDHVQACFSGPEGWGRAACLFFFAKTTTTLRQVRGRPTVGQGLFFNIEHRP